MATKLTPIDPGEVLLADLREPFGLSQCRLARDLSVAPRRINESVHGTRAITADAALRLGWYFGTSPQFSLNVQRHYDLEVEQDRLGERPRSELSVYARAREPWLVQLRDRDIVT
jgi:addiction module HigA family antidote